MALIDKELRDKGIYTFVQLTEHLKITDPEQISLLEKWISHEKEITKEHAYRDGENSVIGQFRTMLKLDTDFE